MSFFGIVWDIVLGIVWDIVLGIVWDIVLHCMVSTTVLYPIFRCTQLSDKGLEGALLGHKILF